MPCRGLRGATTATGNTPEEILAATRELLAALCAANELSPSELASAIFTVTPDLTAAFPARAARDLGWTQVPLLDAVEVAVPGALPRCIRVLLHWNTDRPIEALRPVYLHAATALRPDWAEEQDGWAAVAPASTDGAAQASEGTRRGEQRVNAGAGASAGGQAPAPGDRPGLACAESGHDGQVISSRAPEPALIGQAGRPADGAVSRSLAETINGACAGAIERRPQMAEASPQHTAASVQNAEPIPQNAEHTTQNRPPSVTVAYQGEPGAYSQEAIFCQFGRETGTLACQSFDEIFAAVEEGRADLGLLPIENSQTGSIHQSYDLLLDHDLHVVGEVKLRVRHCLLVPPGTRLADVQRVRSHPQALAQVERYLKRRGWQAVPAYDTAGAARELAADPQPGTAAIASALAGQIYGLDALETGVEDAVDNTTRFFVLSREATWPAGESPAGTAGRAAADRPAGYKTSLVFATTHTPGALHRALGEFADRGLNLTKIESRPRRNRPWHYVFYLDLEGHWQDPPVAQALVALLARSAFLKLLGSYQAAE